MASDGGALVVTDPVDQSLFFKGHPQPPVDERLQEAKNFLADEDPNRCLGFDGKLGQVEEYIKHIEEEKFEHNKILLRDVKVMAEVHRDWAKRSQQTLPDTTCREGPSILPVSTRLLSAETLQNIQEEKEAMGVAIQMREDHPPFTVAYEDDQRDFLQAMRDDACIDPMEVDEGKNLLWVESRAYGWALREPALIPMWLHPTKGIPNTAIPPDKPKPWYRSGTVFEAAKASRPDARPPLQFLPNYLKARQDWINQLLAAGSDRTEEGQRKLEDLLYLHEPTEVRKYHDKYLDLQEEQRLEREEAKTNKIVASRPSKFEDQIEVAQSQFQKHYSRWVQSFQRRGVQLMLLHSGLTETNMKDVPGVFYVPSEDVITQDRHIEVKYAQQFLDQIRASGWLSLRPNEMDSLIKTFRAELDPEEYKRWKRGQDEPSNAVSTQLAIPDNYMSGSIPKWFDDFAQKYSKLRILNPGELPNDETDCFNFEWNFAKEQKLDQAMASRPIPGYTLYYKNISGLEWDLNRWLEWKHECGGNFPVEKNQDGPLGAHLDYNEQLEHLLGLVAHPVLRTRIYQANLAKEKLSAQLGFFPSDKDEAAVFEARKKEIWNYWLTAIDDRNVAIRDALPDDNHWGRLYWRGDLPAGQNKQNVLKRREGQINSTLNRYAMIGITPNNDAAFYKDMKELLQPVRYHRLLELENRYQTLAYDDAKRRVLEKDYNTEFENWINTLRNIDVEVLRCPPGPGNDWRGDPTTLFYRGTISPSYPHFIYHLGVSPFKRLTDDEINEVKAQLDRADASGENQDPIQLGETLEDYLPNELADARYWPDVDQVFIPHFDDWKKRIRAYNANADGTHKLPISTTTPAAFQTISGDKELASWINFQLKQGNLSVTEEARLEARILRLWRVQHMELEDNIRAFMASEGYSEAEIDGQDWSIRGRCQGGFQQFVDECRTYELLIRRTPRGEPYAVSGKAQKQQRVVTSQIIPAVKKWVPNRIQTMTGAGIIPSGGGTSGTGGALAVRTNYGSTTTTIPLGNSQGRLSKQERAQAQAPEQKTEVWSNMTYELLEKFLTMKYKQIVGLMAKLRRRNFRFYTTFSRESGRNESRKIPDPDVLANALRLQTLFQDFYPDALRDESQRLTAGLLKGDYLKESAKTFNSNVMRWIDDRLSIGGIIIDLQNTPLKANSASNQLRYRPLKKLIAFDADGQVSSTPVEPPNDADEAEARNEGKPPSTAATTQTAMTDAENKINPLLRKRDKTLGEVWDLYTYLSAVMPPDLRNAHDAFVANDEKIKNEVKDANGVSNLTADERASYRKQASEYDYIMTSWIGSLGGRVQIKQWDGTGTPPTDGAGVVFWNGLGESARPVINLSQRSLYISEISAYLNTMMNRIGADVLTDREIEDLTTLMHQQYLQFTNGHRKAIQDELESRPELKSPADADMEYPIMIQPERIAYADARMDIGFRKWLLLLKSYLNALPVDQVHRDLTSPLDFQETRPGVFDMTITNTLGDARVREAAENCKSPNGWLRDSETEFLKLAGKLRRHEQLSLAEKDEASARLLPISLKGIEDLISSVARLELEYYQHRQRTQSNEPWAQNKMDQLREENIRYHWQRLGYEYPALRLEVLSAQDAKTPDAKANLLKRTLLPWDTNWSQQGLAPEAYEQPTESETVELQIEINNLLTKWKRENNLSLSEDERSELTFLLDGPILPPQLLAYKREISRLGILSTSETGLNASDSLRLLGLRRAYISSFEHFVDQLAATGMVLDEFWYPREAIAGMFSRAMEWKRAATYPSLGPVYLSKEMERPHITYSVLRKHLDIEILNNIEPSPGLLLRSDLMPQDLKDLYRDLRQTINNQNQGLQTEIQLRHMDDNFIIRYLDWYRTLTAEEIANSVSTLQNGSMQGVSAQVGVDFTSKAERRGIQRAAIEHALTLLATNQEQHRPKDRFRVVELPQKYLRTPKEVPLWLPLEASKRPVEMDPLEFTKKMLTYQIWKDLEYERAWKRIASQRPGLLQAPLNFNGPFTLHTARDMRRTAGARRRQLTIVLAKLEEAQRLAPRILMEQLLLRTQDGMNMNTWATHRLRGKEPLTESDLRVIEELYEPSWDEERKAYDRTTMGLTDAQFANLEEFEMDVEEHKGLLPLWKPQPTPPAAIITNIDDEALYRQEQHRPDRPSQEYLELVEFKQRINTTRLLKASIDLHLWTEAEAIRYLSAMHEACRIHFDAQNKFVSRIPLSGHPENKYVVSKDSVAASAGVRSIGPKNTQWEVQYDAKGTMGPVIIQPNKYFYMQKVAYKLGRDITQFFSLDTRTETEPSSYLAGQYQAMTHVVQSMDPIFPQDKYAVKLLDAPTNGPTEVTLERMARDLNKLAPELARDAGIDPNNMDDREAASLLQMEVLEETNNSWESRFPENEHVWEFAKPRVELRDRTIRGRVVQVRDRQQQFFDLCRYPVCEQSQLIRRAIEESGPIIQEKPKLDALPAPDATDDDDVPMMPGGRPVEVHRDKDRPPRFPFGETPIAAAWESYKIERDLADVPEFQSKPEKKSWFSRAKKPRQSKIDPSFLPKITEGWQPENIDYEDLVAQRVEEAKKQPGFPNPNILENYHTKAEIAVIRRKEAFEKDQQEKQNAVDAIEKHLGKKIAKATDAEKNKAMNVLKINPFDPRLPTPAPPPVKKTKKQLALNAAALPPAGSPQGPARNTRSKSPAKRPATNPPAGEALPKKKKVGKKVKIDPNA